MKKTSSVPKLNKVLVIQINITLNDHLALKDLNFTPDLYFVINPKSTIGNENMSHGKQHSLIANPRNKTNP